ncbi:MAG: YjbH domain-containing protein [Symbiopectobacterium sp.]
MRKLVTAMPIFYADAQQVTIVADQEKYRNKNDADQRAATILANHMPESVGEYHIVRRSQRLPVESTVVDTKAFRDVQSASIPLGQPEPVSHREESISGQSVLREVIPRA